MDYYEVMDLKKTATKTEIKNKYKELAVQFHPDKNTSLFAVEKFKKINEAYKVLSDTQERKRYDLQLKNEAIEKQNQKVEAPQRNFMFPSFDTKDEQVIRNGQVYRRIDGNAPDVRDQVQFAMDKLQELILHFTAMGRIPLNETFTFTTPNGNMTEIRFGKNDGNDGNNGNDGNDSEDDSEDDSDDDSDDESDDDSDDESDDGYRPSEMGLQLIRELNRQAMILLRDPKQMRYQNDARDMGFVFKDLSDHKTYREYLEKKEEVVRDHKKTEDILNQARIKAGFEPKVNFFDDIVIPPPLTYDGPIPQFLIDVDLIKQNKPMRPLPEYKPIVLECNATLTREKGQPFALPTYVPIDLGNTQIPVKKSRGRPKAK